jgi:hypothetical protein
VVPQHLVERVLELVEYRLEVGEVELHVRIHEVAEMDDAVEVRTVRVELAHSVLELAEGELEVAPFLLLPVRVLHVAEEPDGEVGVRATCGVVNDRRVDGAIDVRDGWQHFAATCNRDEQRCDDDDEGDGCR